MAERWRDFVLLPLIRLEDNLLDVFPALYRNRMSHIFVFRLDQLGVQITARRDGKFGAALVAVKRTNDIPVPALGAGLLHAPGRHGHKIAFVSFDDFDVPHHEAIVKGNGGESPKFFVGSFFWKNPDFCDFHCLKSMAEEGGLSEPNLFLNFTESTADFLF